MKKKLILPVAAATFFLASCGGGYSEEAGKAADDVCECAKDLNLEEIKESQDMGSLLQLASCLESAEEFVDGDEEKDKELSRAIKDKCPDFYEQVEKME